MKHLIISLFLLLVLSLSSCEPIHHIKFLAGVTLGRVAVTENRYPDKASCIAAAKEYDGSGNPKPASEAPLIYSFEKSYFMNLKPSVEVRYTVDSLISGHDILAYYQIESLYPISTDKSNKDEIDKAVEVLKGKKAVVVQPVALDGFLTNGRKSWRAIMKAEQDIEGDESVETNNKIKAGTTFGIVINPPYP